MKVYVVRADYGHYTDAFLKNDYVGIGWFANKPDSYDLERIKEHYKKEYPDDSKMRAAVNCGQINRFINEMSIKDIVITPYNNQNLIVGEISSEIYIKSDGTSPYDIRKKVKWLKTDINRTNFSIPLQNTLRSSQTVFKVSQINEILDELGKKRDTKDGAIAEYTTTSVYDSIREHLLELDAAEFELLVSKSRTLGGFLECIVALLRVLADDFVCLEYLFLCLL